MNNFPEMRPVQPSGATQIDIRDDDQLELALTLFSITEEADRARHIDKAITALYNVINDSGSRSSDVVNAAKLLLEVSGALGKNTVNNTYVNGENVQVNNTEITDQDAKKLKDAFAGIGKLLQATDAGISYHKGGQGI